MDPLTQPEPPPVAPPTPGGPRGNRSTILAVVGGGLTLFGLGLGFSLSNRDPIGTWVLVGAMVGGGLVLAAIALGMIVRARLNRSR